jgi:acetyl-CoA synthetase
LADYAATRAAFDWTKARALLDGLPEGQGLNIAHEAVDRHLRGPRADRVALRWLGKSGERREFTYRHLAAETNRFANVLTGLGLAPGGRVFTLLGRVPELYRCTRRPKGEMRRVRYFPPSVRSRSPPA